MEDVKIEWPFAPDQRKAEAQKNLQNVKCVLAIASGKGGVGKSTVTVDLARALAQAGYHVGVVDADLYGPSIPLLMNLENAELGVMQDAENPRILPAESNGIKVVSIGFMVPPEKALLWRGPMASNALKQLFTEVEWGTLDFLLIDLPPGTGDIHITIAQTIPIHGVLMVTTPQQLSVADVRKAIDMFQDSNVKIPIWGLIENMAYFEPEDHPQKYYIFGQGGADQLSKTCQLPVLTRIPIAASPAQHEAVYLELTKQLKEKLNN